MRVLVVDDQPVFREVARQLLDATRGFEMAGECESAREALDAVSRLRPDLVLIDIRMPDMDGVEAASRIVAEEGAPVVVLISIEEPRDVPAARDCGAAAFVRKQDLGPGLLRRIWFAYGAS